MCGIYGKYYYNGARAASDTEVRKMTSFLSHRGPDDEGYYVRRNMGLGFRRLSIIDIQGGHQPMSDADGKVWIVFNGEIYNFRELRKQLENDGYTFRTKSDTEVILNGYKKWGADVLHRLNGMFGLAIWDERNEKLILARDRLGIKLLYYYYDGSKIIFSSEIKPIINDPEYHKEIDYTSLKLFLQYRYTPSPFTAFKKIYKLAPGESLIVENGKIENIKWWDYRPEMFENMPSLGEAAEELRHLYKKAIQRQLISDVPLGILLSGGIDSGLLLAMMSEEGNRYESFSVGLGEKFKDDELADAEETARIYNSPNHQTSISKNEYENGLSRIMYYLEEPIASSSIVPMYYVCKKARENVKVALIGQGPDEMYGGYKRHYGVYYGKYWRSMPRAVQGMLAGILGKAESREYIRRGLYALSEKERTERYRKIFSIMPAEEINLMFNEDVDADNDREYLEKAWHGINNNIEGLDELGGFSYMELRSALPDELLMYADKLSMANSLELRVPYLDHEIVEYAEKLASSYKIRNGNRKYIHKKVCEKYLSPKIISRKKRGFAVNAVESWYRSSMDNRMKSVIKNKNSRIYEYINYETVNRFADLHMEGKQDNHKIIFSLIALEEWMRCFH